ncbi:MAG: hypothetical protein D6729_13895 [Deltaproteobacteria bacterium]|nr:MAG: hypothetical protein D6729_13895 [Deltaproteobacteria bacterium]
MRMTKHRSTLFILPAVAALLLTACGAPLADGNYDGEPLYTLRGRITGSAQSASANAYMGIVWVNWAKNGDTVVADVAPVQATHFPANFDFALFDPPPAEAIMDLSGPDEDAKIATGFLFAFDDIDGDGTFVLGAEQGSLAGGDALLGVSWSQALVYVDTPPRAGGRLEREGLLFTNPLEATPGYHLGAGVCASVGEVHDRLEITQEDTPVDIALLQQPAATFPDVPDSACLDFF